MSELKLRMIEDTSHAHRAGTPSGIKILPARRRSAQSRISGTCDSCPAAQPPLLAWTGMTLTATHWPWHQNNSTRWAGGTQDSRSTKVLRTAVIGGLFASSNTSWVVLTRVGKRTHRANASRPQSMQPDASQLGFATTVVNTDAS
jgi:hypothetical protein